MNWFQRLLRRDRLERELDAELQFHVDRLVSDYTAAGLSEIEARRRALREFGAVESVKDDCRRARGTEWLRDLIADARIGSRVFSKEPGFSSVAVIALALGLGVNTIFFSIFNTFCLSGLPFPHAAHLVDVSLRDDAGRARPFSPAQVKGMRDVPPIERLGFYATRPGAVRTSESAARQATIAYMSDAALALIGETPTQGRAFRSEEYREPHGRTVVLSRELARDLFGSDTAAVGQDVIIDGVPMTVLGVLPERAQFPDGASVWKPLSSLSLPDNEAGLTVFARLKGTAAVAAAATEIDAALRRQGVLASDRQRISIVPLNDRYRGRPTEPVWIAFLTAGALVLLIACSNVSNLLLARGARRTMEIATRLSLGATRSRLFRQLLTETLVLVTVACVAAVFVSWTGLRAFKAAIPQGALPYWIRLNLDARTMATLLGIGMLTVVLSGLAPAIHLVRLPRVPFNVRTMSQSRSMSRWSSAFLVIQLSISILLLCAVGITVQVYRALANNGAQTRIAEILSADLSLPTQRYATPEKRESFFKDVRRKLFATGQVASVSFAGTLPGTRGEPRTVRAGSIRGAGALANTVVVDSGYFTTLGVPLLSGRDLKGEDRDANGSAVLVNDRFARLFFGDASIVGHQIELTSDTVASAGDSRTIVGVVPSFRGDGGLAPLPTVYVPRSAGASARSVILMRGVVPPQELAPPLRAAIAEVDPDVPLADVLPLNEAAWQARWNGRISQALITIIASVGLCLAMIGVAALTAHRVASRARELSIRVALGATPAQLLRTVLGPTMIQLSAGLLFGGLLAKAWARAFASTIAANDNLVLVSVLVGATTFVFSTWPARRAARADPVEALRSDG
jgi:predicted permease